MKEIVECPKCGRRFPNNTKKHKYRVKYSPCCKAPYSKPMTLLPSIDFRRIREPLQKLFNFFPKKAKEVYYVCPNCGNIAYDQSQFKVSKLTGKTKETVVGRKRQLAVLTYKDVPTCKECNTNLVRKSRKPEKKLK